MLESTALGFNPQQEGPLDRLPCPVIIPQRRPRDRSRGFARAYAPVLANCGVSQEMFLHFIKDFYEASKASNWLNICTDIQEVKLTSIGQSDIHRFERGCICYRVHPRYYRHCGFNTGPNSSGNC